MGLDNQNIHGADAMVAKLKAAKIYLQQDAPEVIGIEAVKHFKQNFANEGFDNEKWAARKTKTKLQRKILTGQGSGDHLADSIDYKVSGKIITIYTDKIYGKIHNEGGKITVTPQMKKYFWAMMYEAKESGDADLQQQYKCMALAKEITIQQRKFIGKSPVMMNKMIEKIKRDLMIILNS